MKSRIDSDSLDVIFRKAHTHTHWRPEPVSDQTLREIYELARLGPTSANSNPMRLVLLRTPAAKDRLKPALAPPNVAKAMSAPVTAIVADDMLFYEHLPRLYPQSPAFSEMFKKPGQEQFAQATAFRNSTLQGAYFIIAARALGLDCGPMSGFDNAKVDAEFFPNGQLKSNFLINLGHGDAEQMHPRNPRLSFEEACTLL